MDKDYISKKYNINSLVVDILLKRGIDSEDKLQKFLYPDDSCFYDPFLLSGMNLLVKRVNKAVQERQKILIFGDYDVDGVSASAILIKYFSSIGVYVDYFLPNRYLDGYGLSIDSIAQIKDKFNPDLIITVDCGISCYDEIEYAKSLGIDVIVTDHHDIPDKIPDTIVINPKLSEQKYPFKFLCGTGVAFKIVQALSNIQEAKKYLGIASIATIADIVPLKDENRAIVKLGMNDYEHTLPLGLKMLFKEINLPLNTNSTDIAFKLAPKINAAGRMGDASVALMLYIKNDKIQLRTTIESITNMNLERQALCNKVYDDANKKLKNINIANYPSIILFSKDWDSGILGIVAAKIANEYHRPTILFSEVGEDLKGSARSINDIDIYSAISSLKEVLDTFGGHKMAAGLTIKKSNFNEFLVNFNKYLENHYKPKDFLPINYYDLDLKPSQLTINFVNSLEVLEPCGCENIKPIFNVSFDKDTTFNHMPKHPNHITITNKNLSVVAFNSYKYLPILRLSNDINIQMELEKNEFRGKQNVKGLAKNISTGVLNKLKTNDYLYGVYLKQLSYTTAHKKFFVYQKNTLKKILQQAEREFFGYLFVCSSFESYQQICSLNPSKNIQHYMFEVIHNSGINSIIVSPINFKNFGAYKKIIFLDMVLDEGFVGAIQQNTSALLYLPNDKKVKGEIFDKLSTNRSTFGKVFKLISTYASKQLSFLNEIDLYKHISSMDKSISFSQFIFCLYVFIELNIFEMQEEFGFLSIKENKKVISSLSASKFYNKVSLIKQTIK